MMQSIKKSNKLNNVCYDIRGPVLKEAKRLEDQGYRVLRLNIGRLYEQRETAWRAVNAIPGISCTKPAGAFYLFPRIDVKKIFVQDDMQFIYDLLLQEKILVVQGTGFNWPQPDHFRIVFLPQVSELKTALSRMQRFFSDYRQ